MRRRGAWGRAFTGHRATRWRARHHHRTRYHRCGVSFWRRPPPWRGRGRPATPEEGTLCAASGAASAAAPPAAQSPDSDDQPAAAAAAAPAPDGRSLASSPAYPCLPTRRRHGQKHRCRHGYTRPDAPPHPLALPFKWPRAATSRAALVLAAASPEGGYLAPVADVSHSGGCGRQRPRRLRPPGLAVIATAATTGYGARVSAPPPGSTHPHGAEARSVQPHGGATRPWPAATPRPAHPVCVSPGTDPRVRRRPRRPSPWPWLHRPH